MRMQKSLRIILVVFLCVVVGGFSYNQGRQTRSHTINQKADEHSLLARRVFSDNPKDPLINFGILRNDLNRYFTDNDLRGSLYFEYIPTGMSIHIRGDEMKAAASLLKVPLAMEVYKAIERGKLTESQQIALTPAMLDSGFGSLYKKGAGYTLTVEDAVKIMLTESDNTAVKALSDTLGDSLHSDESVFNYLDTAIEQQPDLSVLIGARGYSSILKCLHFACYLTPEDSEQILQYLTETPFNDRLVAGIPDKTIKIAHKIGVFQETTQSDCGIVYLSSRPYILCVMIDGQDDEITDEHIRELSAKVYTYVTKQ